MLNDAVRVTERELYPASARTGTARFDPAPGTSAGRAESVLNRILRLLETVNVKLGSVASDISGKTARLILAQISKGNYVPEELAKLAQASLKNKKAELTASLQGFYTEHFR